MKKTNKILSSIFALVASICGGAAMADTYTDGDIYDIVPVVQVLNDWQLQRPYTTSDLPVTNRAEKLHFIMELQKRSTDDDAWQLVYTGYGSPTLDELADPLMIKLYVSGKPAWAKLLGTGDVRNTYYTDFVFEYQTRTGDFAMPIRLGGESGPIALDGANQQYQFYNLRDATHTTGKWAIMNKSKVESTNELRGDFFNPFFRAEITYPSTSPWGVRSSDYSLSQAGFYVKMSDFDEDWEAVDPDHPDDETKNYWRSVHENSSHIGHQSGAARIWANGETEDVVEFYAWSMDETVFRVRSSTKKKIIIGYETDPISGTATPIEKEVYYAKVVLNKTMLGQSYGEVPLFGVDGGYGRTAKLVVSPYLGFTFDKSNNIQKDYIEAPIYCSEKEQATLYASVDPVEITADGDWENAKASVCVYVNQDLEQEVKSVLTVSFDGDSSVSNWCDYVRFSTENTGSLPTAHDSSNALQIAGIRYASTKQFIYIYPVRSDTLTRSPNKVRIQATLDEASMAAAGIKAIAQGATFTIKAANPVVKVMPTSDSVESGVALPLEVTVSDIYADVMCTNKGYTVYVNNVKLEDEYFFTDEKLQTTNGTLPSVTFANAGADKEVRVKVTSPISGKSGEGTATVTVRDVTTAVLELIGGTQQFNEGNQIDFQLGFFSGDEQVKLGQDAYAFLYSEEEIDLGKFNADFIITNKNVAAAKTSGIRVNGSVSTWTQASMMALDGANVAGGGAQYRFQVVLCSSRAYDPSKREGLTAYPTSEELNFRVYNVEPTISGIYVNDSADAYDNGSTYTVKVPVGQTRRFRPDITDPGQFDLEATKSNELFKVQWTIYCDGEQWDEDTHIVEGCPVETESVQNPTNFYFEFPQAGTWTLRCKVKDKDMSKYTQESCSINVIVLDQPSITIKGPSGEVSDESRINETDVGSARFYLSTDYFDNKYKTDKGLLTIQLKVGEYGGGETMNAGAIEFATNEYVRLASPGVYEIDLNSNRKIVTLSANRLDGTKFSSTSGFELKATMLTTAELPTPKKPANEYYLDTTHRVFINNIEPTVQAMEPNSSTNGWTVGKAISWEVLDDVIDDFTNKWSDGETIGIQVKVTGCANNFITNITEATSFEFTPEFSTVPDTYAVLLSIKDKDGVAQTWTYYFDVKASKTLVTRAVGPSDGQSAKGKQYYLLSGIGAGHTYAEKAKATFVKSEGFASTWNCARNSAVNVYAFGYKFGEYEGALEGQSGKYDIAIDYEGNRDSLDVEIPDDQTYFYTSNVVKQSTYAQKFAKGEKDSFRYCYLLTERGQGQSATTTTMLDNAPDPEVPVATAKPKTVNLPTELTGEGSYVETLVEAVFSKEYRSGDNLGDINQDGIPDVFVSKTWANGKLLQLMYGLDEVDGDKMSLTDANPDGDYLPGVFLGGNEVALVAGQTASWAPIGKPFTAYREIRGLSSGLNDTGTYTYSDPDLSDTEAKALRAACGLGKDTKITREHLQQWTPNPQGDFERLDPTKADTDGDSFPDGWEYYIWYQAHVEVPGGSYKKKEMHVYPFEKFNPEKFVTGDEIPCSAVENQFNPLVARTKDTPTDFDNDGLSDYEEYIIGTNPAHWDTDGDQMCDGWEVMNCLNPLAADHNSNADGDYMACIVYKSGKYVEFTDADGNLRFGCAVNGASLPDAIPDEGGDYELYLTVKDYNCGPMKYGRAFPLSNGEIEKILNDQMELPRWGLYVLEPKKTRVHINGGTAVQKFVVAEDPIGAIHIHDQVYDVMGGFDPRVGWYNQDGLLGARWKPLEKRSQMDPTDIAGKSINTAPYNAFDEYLVAYYRYVYIIQYFGGYACELPSMTSPDRKPASPKDGTWSWLAATTTNPSIGQEQITVWTNELGEVTTETNLVASTVGQALADALRGANSQKTVRTNHGADTDNDGAPDGWELYTRRSPNTSPNDSDDYPGINDPDDPGYSGLKQPLDFDDDRLTYAMEFASVDGCEAYKHCETIYKNHPGLNKGWWNKFLPTNPDDPDSDDDYIFDGEECDNFIYGDLGDQGGRCNRGGGLNPLCGDTDFDGLPDLWEVQYQGVTVDLMTHSPIGGGSATNVVTVTNATWIADGVQNIFKKGVYVAAGMDGTWGGDGFTDPYEEGKDGTFPEAANSYDPVTGTIRDVDFDHDGLENWQEYLVQAMRHFRYDDFTTPLMGRILWEGWQQSFFGFVPFNPSEGYFTHSTLPFVAAAAVYEAGEDGIIVETVTNGWTVLTNRLTGSVTTNYYTEVVTNVASAAKIVSSRKDVESEGSLYWSWDNEGWRKVGYMCLRGVNAAKFYPEADATTVSRMYGLTALYDQCDEEAMPKTRKIGSGVTWGRMMPPLLSEKGPNQWPKRLCAKYVSTDPRKWDSDGDGMSDYYELFHGLNPLLGSSEAGVNDVIADAYGMSDLLNARKNPWTWPDYDVSAMLNGEEPVPARNGEPLPMPMIWDTMMYPWMAGAPEADPDGDGLRNAEEMLFANSTSPNEHHTDPSPRWFTDSTLPMSFVSQYYNWNGLVGEGAWASHYSTQGDMWYETSIQGTRAGKRPEYICTFEENEGYDTDNDWIADGREIVKTVKVATDPLDATDPARRQAAWFDGTDSFLMSKTANYRQTNAADLFKQFTVEAWVCPQKAADGTAQSIVERSSVYDGDSINNFAAAVRANFRLGIDGQGRVYGMFDNSDAIESGFNQPMSCQILTGQTLPLGKWTHVALTYNGSELVLYVNGLIAGRADTALIPANGLVYETQDIGSGTLIGKYVFHPTAVFIGARPVHTESVAERSAMYDISTVRNDLMRDFFGGWIDEVRCWDGARTSGEVLENYQKRLTLTDASANRLAVFQVWVNGGTRNDNDGMPMLPAELMMLWNFNNLPGAVNAADVAKTPAGFEKYVLGAVESLYEGQNPDAQNGLGYDITTSAVDSPKYNARRNLKGGADGTFTLADERKLECGWWMDCQTKSLVYDDYSVIPWVENTCNCLPAMDGSVLDDFYYAEQMGGIYSPVTDTAVSKFLFPNSANPYHDMTFYLDRYIRLFHYKNMVEQFPDRYDQLQKLYQFDVRTRLIGNTDLLPMGHCFAKQCTMYWDGAPGDSWEYSRSDDNGNGISEWWEEYARSNYGQELDPGQAVNWDTEVNYYGSLMPAYRAFLIDLARGLQPDGEYHDEYRQTADADGDNLPDWWEDLFGVTQYTAEDDPDNDGLSNYAEYLLSFGDYPYGLQNGFPMLNPLNPRSGTEQHITDYFLPGPDHDIDANGKHVSANSYLGEMVTDHDFIENWWESTYSLGHSSAYIYDASLDSDSDGWDNFNEARAFTWSGGRNSDLIDKYFGGEEDAHELCYPEPTLELRVNYFGTQVVNAAPLVVRTRSAQSTRVDCTMRVPGSADGTASLATVRLMGCYYGDSMLRGTMGPGHLVPSETLFSMSDMKNGITYYWNCEKCDADYVGGAAAYHYDIGQHGIEHITLDQATRSWTVFATAESDDSDGRMSSVYVTATNSIAKTRIGFVNNMTGEYEIDLGLAAAAGFSFENMMFRCSYSYLLGENWPQTVYVCGVGPNGFGHVRQGKNTIEAFLDLNNNGEFDIGEPYGMLQDVDIGWHKVPLAVLELTDASTTMSRTAIDDGSDAGSGMTGAASAASTKKVVVRRKTINGESVIGNKTVPVRVLASKVVVMDDRPYLTEADVVTSTSPDLDWRWLVRDAEKLGISQANISRMGYDVEMLGVDTNGVTVTTTIASFENEFGSSRPKPIATRPVDSAPIYSARPTFAFSCGDDTVKAYRLQVATADTNVVYDTGINILPGRSTLSVGRNGYEVSPEIYVNCQTTNRDAFVFADSTNYLWRVALYNSKYNNDDESAYSDWREFQMDVANRNRYPRLPTGYGNLAVAVRYFGPARTLDLTNAVVVEVFANADFTGAPIARKRIVDISQLSDTDDIETVNVTFSGIEPGRVYVRAYIDQNDNNQRDDFESFGYVCQVGQDLKAIYQPVPITVTDEILAYPKSVLYIEDCDTNRNEIPDCIEDSVFATGGDAPMGGDVDEDGIADTEEDGYGTDAMLWDTDGDRMPDGWEAKFADTDPNFMDADEVADGDVMAFAVTNMTFVSVRQAASDGSAEYYILPRGAAIPTEGDDANGLVLYTTYKYPVCEEGVYTEYFGRGEQVTITGAPGEYIVSAVASGEVALVHAQVYREFGFNPLTATTAEGAPNTKPFTALDKYLVCRYLASLGICDETAVNVGNKWSEYTLKPYVHDYDSDGMTDGWELYMMFGDQPMTKATWDSGNIISPWNYADRFGDADGDGLINVLEYSNGNQATDLWNVDTDNDGIIDRFAYYYHLKGDEAGEDNDGDGLSNYAEYLISEVFQFAKLDPDNAHTDGTVLDYFRKVGDLYFGEIFTDHDRIPAEYEELMRPECNRDVYDCHVDGDEDGWDNYDEYRAYLAAGLKDSYSIVTNLNDDGTIQGIATNVTQVSAYTGTPAPYLDLEIVYHGDQTIINTPVKAHVYNGNDLATPACSFGATSNEVFYSSGVNRFRGVCSVEKGIPMTLRGGKVAIAVWADLDGNGLYTAGEPYGFVKNVDMGWYGASTVVELTDTHPVFGRVDIGPLNGGQTGQTSGNNATESVANDREVIYGTDSGNKYFIAYNEAGTGGAIQRIRVLRAQVNGQTTYSMLGSNKNAARIVYDKFVNLSAKGNYFTEADILAEALDIDWDYLASDFKDVNGFTNIHYGIIRGNGDWVTATNLMRVAFSRTFDNTQHIASVVRMKDNQSIVYGGHPVFEWTTAPFDTYTCFQVQVFKGSTKVWESGYQPMPVRMADGFHSWECPITVGNQLENNEDYTWNVQVFNAKYKAVKSDKWSAFCAFSTAVNSDQQMNDHDYGSIGVAVRYYGPSKVLEKVSATATKGAVIVQAFERADFTGAPIGAVKVSDKASLTAVSPTNNVSVGGLRMVGSYYLRAFIDMNGNGTLEDFEPWGVIEDAVELKTSELTQPIVALIIEDSDTDGDWLPDAWEYASAGWDGDWDGIRNAKNASLTEGLVLSDKLSAALGDGTLEAAVSAGARGSSLTMFRSGNFATVLLGLDLNKTATIGDIRSAVEGKVTPGSVRITSLTIDQAGNKAVLTVGADVAESVAGEIFRKIYDYDVGKLYATVEIKVYRKDTLAEADWTLVDTVTTQVGRGDAAVEVPFSPKLDFSSGFYKVEVEQ